MLKSAAVTKAKEQNRVRTSGMESGTGTIKVHARTDGTNTEGGTAEIHAHTPEEKAKAISNGATARIMARRSVPAGATESMDAAVAITAPGQGDCPVDS